jgi:hypothetical protein
MGANRVAAAKDIKSSHRDGAGTDIALLSWPFV